MTSMMMLSTAFLRSRARFNLKTSGHPQTRLTRVGLCIVGPQDIHLLDGLVAGGPTDVEGLADDQLLHPVEHGIDDIFFKCLYLN